MERGQAARRLRRFPVDPINRTARSRNSASGDVALHRHAYPKRSSMRDTKRDKAGPLKHRNYIFLTVVWSGVTGQIMPCSSSQRAA